MLFLSLRYGRLRISEKDISIKYCLLFHSVILDMIPLFLFKRYCPSQMNDFRSKFSNILGKFLSYFTTYMTHMCLYTNAFGISITEVSFFIHLYSTKRYWSSIVKTGFLLSRDYCWYLEKRPNRTNCFRNRKLCTEREGRGGVELHSAFNQNISPVF